jgi:hypothetical protein
MSKKGSSQIQVAKPSNELTAENTIRISDTEILDMTGLTANQMEELKIQWVSGAIDIQQKAIELKVDAAALEAVLNSFNETVAKATEDGTNITVEHKAKTSLGETNIVTGNTNVSARGVGGGSDKTLWIVGIVAVAAVIIAIAMAAT